jgi:hypothetical protein
MEVGLPRSGLCRKISRDVVFAPLKYQGFGIRHPFIGQGIAKIQTLFDLRQTLSQQLIDTSWQRTMVESGMGAQFLQKKCDWIQDVITRGWIKSLWEFVSLHGITIVRMDSLGSRCLRHDQDRYLMDIVAEKGSDITKADRLIFNSCRLYMQVSLLSDISTADGYAIQSHIWKGIRFSAGA